MAKLETVFITGAASGIGLALAQALAARGATLYLTDVNGPGLEDAVAELTARQVNVHSCVLDVSDRAKFEAAVADAEAKMGGIDILFNNAGVSLSDTVDKMTYTDLEWVMNINFYGVVYGTKAALKGMLKRGHGHIVNISSLFGIIGIPSQSAYCAAKHAVKGFNESLFYELQGTGVLVHSVHPGGVDTNIVRHGKHLHNIDGDIAEGETQERFQALAITTPDQAAAIILDGVEKGDYRILVGKDARWADRLSRWMPNRWRRMFMKKMTERAGKSPF
ncbi:MULTISPECIES: SDR family NAD(P)-dependent oxidoreductase [Kordiimonas]|jgi:NAD(P)-dependent dehydrogenase (short-subunit alcohol dehydrogenase family)|uniref:SDR family NAD(P)-dependent oxidoreductase n=1 Tax=Kordiimonas TaxID=288021 RepID=UPI002580DDF9|nr:SDR family oxidoreductase [Kordiimonas sp. UBA4487]